MVEQVKGVFILFIFIILLAVFAGCGYSLRANGKILGIAIDSLAIPLFESTSTERGFEAEFTEVIRNEFISHAKFPIVSSDQAGAVLSGRIYDIDTQPMNYNTVTQSVGGRMVSYETDGSRKLIVRLEITMTDRTSGKIIWHDGSMEEESNFQTSSDPLKNRYNKEQAIKYIAGLMAKRIYLNTMERF